MSAVTDRQRRFAEVYAGTGDIAAAAKAAGYAAESARSALRSKGVRAALEALRVRAGSDDARCCGAPNTLTPGEGELDKFAPGIGSAEASAPEEARPWPGGDVATAREVLVYLTDVMRGATEGEGRQSGASPRMKAAELLGKRLGVFNEPPPPSAPEGPLIVDDIPEEGEAEAPG